MSSEIDFQPLTLNDLDEVLHNFKVAAHKIALKKVDHWQYWIDPPLHKINWVKEGLRNTEYHRIFLQNHEVGMVRILLEDELYWGKQQATAMYLHSLIVFDQYNGRGLARQIMEAIKVKAKIDRRQFLRLDADVKNQALCKLYQDMGFKKVGVVHHTISSYQLMEMKVN
ncbi:MAG: GNAT family N-acetyltransferase [Nonlabens sp.]